MSAFTIDWLKSVTLADFKKTAGKVAPGSAELVALNELLSSDEGKKIAFEMLNDPDYTPVSQRAPSPEEAAQIAEDEAVAAQQAVDAEAARVAAIPPTPPSYAAEDAALLKEGITVHRDTTGNIIRIIQDYQVLGENDHPIGRPTHLEARSWPELVLKQRTAHENAVRYAERVKTNRFKQSTDALRAIETGQAVATAFEDSKKLAEAAVAEKDPAKLQEAHKKAYEAEKAAQEALDAARQRGAAIAEQWLEAHEEDLVPCEAATKILSDWLNANRKIITWDNLDAAYAATKHQLPKPERQAEVSVAPVVNPPVATVVASVTPPASIPPTVPSAAALPSSATPPTSSQSVVKAPSPAPVAAVQSAPTTRRPGVNGSIPPGSMTIARPEVVAQPTSTRAELLHAINKMSREEYRKKLHDAKFVEQLKAAGIPVAGTR